MDRAQVRDSLTGPVSSIRTPFLRDGSVDWKGLRRQIDFNVEAGSKTMLLTAGDSHFFALSDAEIAEVTRATVEHTDGRAMVVAADRHFSTRQALDFADFCGEAGADMLMVLPPDWAESSTPESLAAHYAAVARHLPVMVVTNILGARGDEFALRTLEQTLDATDNVLAIKDDVCGPFARKMTLMVADRWAVMSGGQKQNHLNLHPYGCDGYLSTFITFKPQIAWRYWSAIEGGNLPAATAVIRDFDMPFFNAVCAVQGGFDAGIHGVLELCGICQRWRRRPYHSLTDTQMADMEGALGRILP